ncbi:transglycosylase SLT domain-containing protein [Citrobacter portucalensis]|uniref:lytic transglycosylase domain-containing protein n=1 Tax=Citrobacter portucalensis TaxID=1639133 RepID=UPI0031403D95
MKPSKIILASLLVAISLPALGTTDSPVVLTGTAIVEDGAHGVDLTEDALFERLIHQESRGNQFGKNGIPLTSPKGAVGVAQVMPETAPEAARLAGLEWSAWRYRNDMEYNKALGRAYLNAQLNKYDGNHVLALSAYNAGPGSVDRWLKTIGDPRTGKITNKEFMQMIPFLETQAYVSTILQGTPGNFRYQPSRQKPYSSSGHKYEFKDTHPGFTFSLAVNQSFSSGGGSKLVGGL